MYVEKSDKYDQAYYRKKKKSLKLNEVEGETSGEREMPLENLKWRYGKDLESKGGFATSEWSSINKSKVVFVSYALLLFVIDVMSHNSTVAMKLTIAVEFAMRA